MTMMSQQTEEKLRHMFRIFNRFMVLMWRLGLGGWVNVAPKQGGQIMVIAHTGRKSGKRHLTPVNYYIKDEEIFCTAGFGSISDWYRNIIAKPSIEVWLKDGWWSAAAYDASNHPNRLEILRQVLIASGAAARALGLDPTKMEDGELEKLLVSYRLVRIQRVGACTGPGGPGELAWVWPALTFFLLPITLLLMFTRIKRK
jgi:deazaflavin-dependent oxidoreductase (nitroreductase family)